MKRPDIKRLTYPIWFQIVFFLLTTIVPLVLLMVQGYKSPSTTFKITFGIISSLVILFLFINHFFIKRFIEKVKERQIKLEHDYEIDVGNSTKIKWLWFTNELKFAAINAITVLLVGSLFAIILTAIANGLMAIKGIIIIIAICYFIAYVLKFVMILILRGKADETND